jgi:hypothetical protein
MEVINEVNRTYAARTRAETAGALGSRGMTVVNVLSSRVRRVAPFSFLCCTPQ